jgi:hypothetical protein
VTWHRDKEYYVNSSWRGRFETEGGGVLINQAIHTLDLMQWFGGKVDSIKGHVDTSVLEDIIEVEDTANATIYYENGAIGIFYATNTFTTNSPVEIQMDFEKGSLRLCGGKLVLSQNKSETLVVDDSKKNIKYKSYWGYSHEKQINEFYKAVLNKAYSGYVSIKEGNKAIKMIFANNAIYCPDSTAVDTQGTENAVFRSNFVQGRLKGIEIDGFRFCDGGTVYDAFAGPDEQNFWPKRGSVLIEKAVSDFAPELDFNYTPRKAPFDVGAYESEGNSENPGWQIQKGIKDNR